MGRCNHAAVHATSSKQVQPFETWSAPSQAGAGKHVKKHNLQSDLKPSWFRKAPGRAARGGRGGGGGGGGGGLRGTGHSLCHRQQASSIGVTECQDPCRSSPAPRQWPARKALFEVQHRPCRLWSLISHTILSSQSYGILQHHMKRWIHNLSPAWPVWELELGD